MLVSPNGFKVESVSVPFCVLPIILRFFIIFRDKN